MENDLEEGEVLDSENEEESNKVRVALGAWPCVMIYVDFFWLIVRLAFSVLTQFAG